MSDLKPLPFTNGRTRVYRSGKRLLDEKEARELVMAFTSGASRKGNLVQATAFEADAFAEAVIDGVRYLIVSVR